MKVPGTTVTLALLPGYVELRDEGRIKKKISTESKSFGDIVKEVKSYFRFFDKRFPPGTIEDVLRQIGVEEELERRKAATQKPAGAVPRGEGEETQVEAEPPTREILTKHHVAGKEVGDISEALAAVESMSDTFRSPKPTDEREKPSGVQVKLTSEKEIVASAASLPKQSSMQENTVETETGTGAPQREIDSTRTRVTGLAKPSMKSHVKTEIEEPDAASQHVIKPVVDRKCLLVGEEGVGKKSLLEAVGLDSETDDKDYIYQKIFQTRSYRVNLHVWSFDDAVGHKIPRNEYYGNADAAIVVYSACDRWSFESLNFWIKELSISREVLPPLIITGNKYDKKLKQDTQESDEYVSEEEGFEYAEKLATQLGDSKEFHPVAFLETSCVDNKNTEKLFQIAAEMAVSER